MNEYTFEYWFRDRDEISDYALVEVKADNKDKALILAKKNAGHKHSRNFKIVDYKEYKEKGEVCNDCGLDLDINYSCYSQTCINNIVVNDTAEITNNL
jgi:hypothetical protein|tara:strand:- start:1525 stop:1818 length:294 start_codon:yes stop_codon:yes gene_type:complete